MSAAQARPSEALWFRLGGRRSPWLGAETSKIFSNPGSGERVSFEPELVGRIMYRPGPTMAWSKGARRRYIRTAAIEYVQVKL